MKLNSSKKRINSVENYLNLHIRREKCNELMCAIGIIFCIFLISLSSTAQPSGGPYGPIPQTYGLPEVTGKIYYVAPDGKAKETGKSLDHPTSLEAAIERVKTGDAIIMRGGTYRTGNLELNQGITIQPYANEQPVLKGTFVATDWEDLENGLWTISWSRLFPSKPMSWWGRFQHGKTTPLYRFNNDMVFIDGKFLQAVGWEGEVDENSYFIDYDSGQVYIGTDPTNRLVEITAFDVGLHRVIDKCHGKDSDRKGPVIRGITFTQYAYRAIEIDGEFPEGLTDESDFGKDVVGTMLEHCTISYCSRVGAYLRGDSLIFRNCLVSNTSTEGIYIQSSNDVLLEKNIFTKNNIEKITGYYPAAVKIFNQSHRVTCSDNLVIDHPYSNGIWYDVGNVDGRFINNWIEGVGFTNGEFSKINPWPSRNGLFFEISKGMICAGNVFVNCDHGILVLNSSDVLMYQNTFVNSNVSIGRNARTAAGDHFDWHPSTGPDVDERDGHIFVNNLLTGDKDFNRPLLFVWNPDTLCGRFSKHQVKKLDNNVYVRNTNKNSYPLILWSPAKNNDCQTALNSPNELHKLYPEFSANSLYFAYSNVPLFKSPKLKDFHLLKDFPGTKSASSLPEKVKTLLGISEKDTGYIGAYPLSP